MVDVREFERAVLCAFETTFADTEEDKEKMPLKQQALAYCEQVKLSPGGWRHSLALLRSTQHTQVQFYALQTLQELATPARLPDAERSALRNALLTWLQEQIQRSGIAEGSTASVASPLAAEACAERGVDKMARFVRTKLAIVLALLVKSDYPERWPSAFEELHVLLSGGFSFIELHLRIFRALDEEVVEGGSSLARRSAEEAAHNMLIKDALRSGTYLQQLFSTWLTLLQNTAFCVQNPRLACMCLATVQLLVPWVDVTLIFNDHFVPLLFSFMRGDGKTAGAGRGFGALRAQSCLCLERLVSKGMPACKKVQLIHQLQLFDVASKLALDDEDNDDVDGWVDEELDFAEAVARLITAAWIELYTCLDEFESQLAAASPAASAATTAVDLGQDVQHPICVGMLSSSLSFVWRLLEHNDIDVSRSVLPVLQNMLGILKRQSQGGGGVPMTGIAARHGFRVIEHVPQLLPVLLKRMRMPVDVGETDSEEFAEADNYRKSLRKVWINLVRVCQDHALSFLCDALQVMLSQLPALLAKPNDHEAFLYLMHAFGEGCAGKLQQMLAKGALLDAVVALHNGMLPIFEQLHETVLLQYIELVVRYAMVLPKSQQVLPVLQALCGPGGLGHRAALVRSRSAYFLLKLCTKLAAPIRNYTGAVVGAIKEQLAIASSDPKHLDPDDQLYLLEVAGLLIGKLPEDESMVKFCAEVVGSQVVALQQALIAARSEPPDARNGPGAQAVARAICAIAHFSKGFRAAAAIQPEFMKFLEATAQVLKERPLFTEPRRKTVFLMHRMCVILDEGVLPALPMMIPLLVSHCGDSDELQELCRLLNMLMIKFKARVASFIEPLFLAFFARCVALVPGSSGDTQNDHTFASNERLQLQRTWFSFIDHMIKHELSAVLYSATNAPQLMQVLDTVIEGCTSPPDLLLHKACFDILHQLVLLWIAGTATPPEEVRARFADFIVQRGTDVMFRCPALPHFDLEDAESNAVLTSIVVLQSAVLQYVGDAYLKFLYEAYLPSINCPPTLAHEFATQLQGAAADRAKLKSVFKEFVRKLKGQ